MRLALSASGLVALVLATSAALAMTGCTTAPRKVGDIEVQGSVTTYNYYAELLIPAEGDKRGKYVLFADPASVKSWNGGVKELTLSKTLIGKGPNKESLQIEQQKDDGQSKIVTRRLLATFNAKHGTSIPLP